MTCGACLGGGSDDGAVEIGTFAPVERVVGAGFTPRGSGVGRTGGVVRAGGSAFAAAISFATADLPSGWRTEGSDFFTVAPSLLSGSAAPNRAGTVGASPSFASSPGFVDITVGASFTVCDGAGRVTASCVSVEACFANGDGIVPNGAGVFDVEALFALAAAARFDGMNGAFGSAAFFVLIPLNFDAGGGTLGLSVRGSGTLGFAMLGSGPFGTLAIGCGGEGDAGAGGCAGTDCAGTDCAGDGGGVGRAVTWCAGGAVAVGSDADFGSSGAGGSVGLPLRADGRGFAALGAIANGATGTAAAFVGACAPEARRWRAGGGAFAGFWGGAVAGFGGGAISSSRSNV